KSGAPLHESPSVTPSRAADEGACPGEASGCVSGLLQRAIYSKRTAARRSDRQTAEEQVNIHVVKNAGCTAASKTRGMVLCIATPQTPPSKPPISSSIPLSYAARRKSKLVVSRGRRPGPSPLPALQSKLSNVPDARVLCHQPPDARLSDGHKYPSPPSGRQRSFPS